MKTFHPTSLDHLLMIGFAIASAVLAAFFLLVPQFPALSGIGGAALALCASFLLLFLVLRLRAVRRRTADAAARQSLPLIKAGALQNAIFNSANFSSIATDAKGVIQIFNVGAERMLGYTAAEVVEQDHAGRHLRPAGSDRCAPRR